MIRNPNHTPPRSVRIEEALWVAAKKKAEERGETVTDVITEALRRYVKRSK
jgi:predicted DNA-binding ribbon-helix-helix protein